MTQIAYSIPQAAEQLSLSESACRRLVRRGVIPSVRLGERLVVPHNALVRLLDAATGASDGAPLGAAETGALTPPLGRSTPATDDAPDHAGKRAVEGVS